MKKECEFCRGDEWEAGEDMGEVSEVSFRYRGEMTWHKGDACRRCELQLAFDSWLEVMS